MVSMITSHEAAKLAKSGCCSAAVAVVKLIKKHGYQHTRAGPIDQSLLGNCRSIVSAYMLANK